MIARLAGLLGAPLARVPRRATADAIVALGAPLDAQGELTEVLAERVAAAVALYHRGAAPLIVMTGGRGPSAKHAPRAEAEAMGATARAAGVPASALVLEITSTNTSRNAFATAALVTSRGVRSVIVVTQPFHLRRSVLWFERAGFEASGHVIHGGVQLRDPRRALHWIVREYVALVRDLILTRRPGG